ncbi:hypothetical protein FOA52_009100 [Chlamydomonas sp. UWO 241]|nr:hypothetical protein FOA52_009100 [Chlamydomonas sp. UWO 241]
MGCLHSKQFQEFTAAAVTAIQNANAENAQPEAASQPGRKPWDQPDAQAPAVQAPAAPVPKPVTQPIAASAASTQPSNAELQDISLCAQKLWDLDTNRLGNQADYKLNVQGGKKSYQTHDAASAPLFTAVTKRVWERPTYKASFLWLHTVLRS